jgi:hypothetical protein
MRCTRRSSSPRSRQSRAATLADEQGDVQIGLQLGDGVRERRRHAMQRGRRGSEAAMALDGVEELQCVEGDFHVSNFERSIQNNSLFQAELCT